MRPSRVGRKVDSNHRSIKTALEAHGWNVLSLAPLGEGVPDLFACKCISVRDRIAKAVFLEVKRPGPPSARKLSPLESQWHTRWSTSGIEVHVVQSPEEALEALGETPTAEESAK